MKRRGLLIILSSPSGAGKSTMAKRLREWDPDIKFSVSATTRAPRINEVDGREYYFVNESEFDQMIAEEQLLEYAIVFGNKYGTPWKAVDDARNSGVDILFDIDWQGAAQIANSRYNQNVLSIFLLPPSIAELRHRLETRGQDSAEVIAKRMTRSWDEISHWDSYDYVLINDDLDATEERLKTIVTAERLRRTQQPGLLDHVRRLQDEFGDLE